MAKIKYIYHKNKYKNTSCKCSKGHIHHSRGEASYCDQLALEEKLGIIKEYEIQKKFILKVNNIQITTHIPDFFITYPDGKKEVREYKGYADKLWPVKKKLFEALYPDIPYIVVRG